jgi:hypothetical protein
MGGGTAWRRVDLLCQSASVYYREKGQTEKQQTVRMGAGWSAVWVILAAPWKRRLGSGALEGVGTCSVSNARSCDHDQWFESDGVSQEHVPLVCAYSWKLKGTVTQVCTAILP